MSSLTPPPLPGETPAAPAESCTHRSILRIPAGKKGGEQARSTPRFALPAGSPVGEYNILAKMGEGGFGITYLAHHGVTGARVVIKEHIPLGLAVRGQDGRSVQPAGPETEIRLEASKDEFLKEMAVLMALRNPGIVPILGSLAANGTIYYVMPHVQGVTPHPSRSLYLEPKERRREARLIRKHLLAMLDTLEYLGQNGVVHRDIKPENIIITEEGWPVLLDFGSARQMGNSKSFTNIYTPAFASPEQCLARTDEELAARLGPWTDLYSLGVVAYYFMMRMLPPRPDQRVKGKPDPYLYLAGHPDLEDYYEPAFLAAVDKALELNPEDRWQSAGEWKAAIRSGQMLLSRQYRARLRRLCIGGGAALAAMGSLAFWAVGQRNDALRLYRNSLVFADGLQRNYNQLLQDAPNATKLQLRMGERIQNYLRTMELMGGDEEKLTSAIGVVHRTLGRIYLQRSETTAAAREYGKAVDIFSRLMEEHPEDAVYAVDLARSYRGLMYVAASRHDTAQMQKWVAALSRLLDDNRERAEKEVEHRMLCGQVMLAEAWMENRNAPADTPPPQYAAALAHYRQMAADCPDNLEPPLEVAHTLRNQGIWYTQHEQPQQAAECLEEAAAICRRLSAENPYRLSPMESLAKTVLARAELEDSLAAAAADRETAARHEDRALEQYAALESLCAEMERLNSYHTGYTLMGSTARTNAAQIYLARGRVNEATRLATSVVACLTPLLERQVDDPAVLMVLARGHQILGCAGMLGSGTMEGSAAEFSAALATFGSLHRLTLESLEFTCSYAAALADAATMSHARGKAEDCRARAAHALNLLESMEKQSARLTPALRRRMQDVRRVLAGLPGGE